MVETIASFCRICASNCPILVTVADGKPVKVVGDPDAPLFDGFTCPKGRGLPEQHLGPGRLLHSMKRDAFGRHRRIRTGQAIQEIAAKVRQVIDLHGPESIALYFGTGIASFWPLPS